LEEIRAEQSTSDGFTLDPLTSPVIPSLQEHIIPAAIDGLTFQTRDALLAFRSGVTRAVVAPKSTGFFSGISTAFRTGAKHRLAPGAILQKYAAVHITMGRSRSGIPAVSTQIAALRNLLHTRRDSLFVAQDNQGLQRHIPLVIQVDNADIMASLINLKKEVDERYGDSAIQWTFVGAIEAHLLAKEIADADIGVIVSPSRPLPRTWDSRRE
jgi:hypothetical protein